MNINFIFLGSSCFYLKDTTSFLHLWQQAHIPVSYHRAKPPNILQTICADVLLVPKLHHSSLLLPVPSIPALLCSTMWLWALQLLQGPEAPFHPKTPWLCTFRAKQNCLEKMDYRIRNYYSTAQGQLYFQCQEVIKVSHFWQDHLTNEIQTIVLWTLMFLQCFNGPCSRTRLTTCSWTCFLC